jgi:hypothetical protein
MPEELMNRWLIATTILVVSAALLSSASASPTTRPDAIPATIYQSASNIRWQVNARNFELKKIPDLSAYLPQSGSVAVGSVQLPGNADLKKIPDISAFLNSSANSLPDGVKSSDKPFGPGITFIPQDNQRKFDPTATLRVPASELRGGIQPYGPSFLFNGVRVYVEPVTLGPQAACTQTTATRK